MATGTSLCCVLIFVAILSALAKMADCDLVRVSCFNSFGEESVSFEA